MSLYLTVSTIKLEQCHKVEIERERSWATCVCLYIYISVCVCVLECVCLCGDIEIEVIITEMLIPWLEMSRLVNETKGVRVIDECEKFKN